MFITEFHEGVEYHFPEHYGTAKNFISAEPQYKVNPDVVLEQKWEAVRIKRNKLIQATDWTQVVDSPLSESKKAEFATYRQALRDLPQSTDNPDEIVWPVKPE